MRDLFSELGYVRGNGSSHSVLTNHVYGKWHFCPVATCHPKSLLNADHYKRNNCETVVGNLQLLNKEVVF